MQQVVQRSRWQAVLLEAGGIGAAVSEESMRRLKYCLQWLQFATTHIDGQIVVLRDFMAAMQPPPGSPHALNPDAIISAEHMRQLSNVKRDVVTTVRQMVEVVSKYAGGALPEPARGRVRGFILHLPHAWASAARRENVAAPPTAPVRGRGARRGARREGSRPVSPVDASSPRHSRQSSAAGSAPAALPAGVPPTASAAKHAAQRILTLATESLDMMRGVTGVVTDSLERADAWVERLRVVGLQRGTGGDEDGAGDGAQRLPPPLDLAAHRGPLTPSTTTSVASSPVVGPAALPALRSPATLSPLVGYAPEPVYFGEQQHSAEAMGLGRLNLGVVGKKGMFAEDGEIVGGPTGWGPPPMEVDG
ncbi:hypothetical protein FA95DRAFT_1560006 [Auriscalpium vulgare]|uniref:Uncharacterized protein n=1 Tax=Auriscalpium vulgare TaxID=40419 RepID=A0ACB8RSE6_9AGAM|nr:hypothetical protein FA95DRAFT_1560006 [Auriscalpium vulgare]